MEGTRRDSTDKGTRSKENLSPRMCGLWKKWEQFQDWQVKGPEETWGHDEAGSSKDLCLESSCLCSQAERSSTCHMPPGVGVWEVEQVPPRTPILKERLPPHFPWRHMFCFFHGPQRGSGMRTWSAEMWTGPQSQRTVNNKPKVFGEKRIPIKINNPQLADEWAQEKEKEHIKP